MSKAPASPTSTNPSDAPERMHRERMERVRLLRREHAEARAQFHQEKASISDTWQRLLELRRGVFADRNVRRAALNLLEDTELARRREEEESAGRERAEAAERASATRYRTLFESIDEAFCLIDVLFDASGRKAVDYRILEANPAFARHTGLVNTVGRTMRELVPAHEEHWFETFGRIALTGEPARFEQRAAALGRDYDVYAFRIGVAGENRVAILFRDISERKRVEESLRASEEQFRRAIEDAPIPVIMHAEDGQVLQISRTWTELTGYTQEDIPTFEAWLNHAYGYGSGLVRERMQAVFAGTQARQQFELQILTRSGERRDWAFTISAPGRLADGRRFAVGMVNDMTERMRAEQELRHSEERLRDADRRKNYFLAMLGHELRNPLAAIRGGISLLQSEKTQAATRARTLPIVADQVAHMERLVDDLLDVTRIIAGRVQLRQQRVTVQEVLRDALEMLRTQIETGGFDIQLRVTSESLTVYGDPIRLNQVVVNVLGNAMKYSGEARRIDLTVSRDPDSAAVSIRDYGQGITPELLPRIFEPFMQAHPAVTLDEGLGLGLAVVRELVELHGGRVEAFSPGERKGSKFVIHLPLAADSI